MAVQDDIGDLKRELEIMRRRVNYLEDRLAIPRAHEPTPQLPPAPPDPTEPPARHAAPHQDHAQRTVPRHEPPKDPDKGKKE